MFKLNVNDIQDLSEYLKGTKYSNSIEEEILYIDTLSYCNSFNVEDNIDNMIYLDRVVELKSMIELLG